MPITYYYSASKMVGKSGIKTKTLWRKPCAVLQQETEFGKYKKIIAISLVNQNKFPLTHMSFGADKAFARYRFQPSFKFPPLRKLIFPRMLSEFYILAITDIIGTHK